MAATRATPALTEPAALQRVLVVGTSGSGKTTLARQLAGCLHLKHVELDRLFWQPGWKAREHAEFRRLVAQAVGDNGWITDGNYGMLRDVLWPRATHALWLNYPLALVLWQATRRTLANIVAAQEVFPGCRETVANSFFSRESVIWYALTTYRERRRRYAALRREQTFPQLTWLELHSPREARQFLSALEAA